MALTKQDLQQIAQLIRVEISGLKQDVSGLKEDVSGLKEGQNSLKEDMFRLREEMKEKYYSLKTEMNEQFLFLNENNDKNTALIGIYFQKCASQEEHQTLMKRVDRIEETVGI